MIDSSIRLESIKHVDAHIHIERGDYSPDWISKFVNQAVAKGLDEIWFLEHCYRFKEFVPMYDDVCAYSDYINTWFSKKAGTLSISNYADFVAKVRNATFPIKIKFGLEVCYFKVFEDFINRQTKDIPLDFCVGSVHFIDNFAFDHKPEHWSSVDVNNTYLRYFEQSIDLAKSGLFHGIAHPDSIKLFGHKPSFSLSPYYDELANILAKNDMYAEMNSGCHRRSNCELGMHVDMIRAMQKYSVRILTASDAHRPEDVGAGIANMEKLIEH